MISRDREGRIAAYIDADPQECYYMLQSHLDTIQRMDPSKIDEGILYNTVELVRLLLPDEDQYVSMLSDTSP